MIRADIVRPREALRQVVRGAFTSIVREAGYELNLVEIVAGRQEQVMPDVSVTFTRDLRGLTPNGRMLAEQSGAVLVGAILNMRVEASPWREPVRADDGSPRRGSYASYMDRTRALWENGELEFACAVGNIAVHELGHTIGGLEHHRDPSNFMFTGASIEDELGHRFRTYGQLRRLWAGPHHFDESQRRRLVDAIRARELWGFETVELRQAP